MFHEVVGNNFEVIRVPLYDGAQYSDDFLRLNPNHAVPVLEITWGNGLFLLPMAPLDAQASGGAGFPGRALGEAV
ncbi:MAG: hypothetical protein ABL989_06450 [Gammaproteobacteria bacterium]